MVFSELIFLCFFMPLFFIFYFGFKKRKYRNIVLLLFSFLFYSWGEPKYVFLMIISVVVNYILGLQLEKYATIIDDLDNKYTYSTIKGIKKNRKRIFIFAIIFNIAIIGIFKYLDFFIFNTNAIFGTELKLSNIPLPIGISFFTFQIMSYIVDVYRKEVKAQESIIDLGAYISAFPQLIAGPIVRYEEVAKELEYREETREKIAEGIRRFMIGMCKKVLIANNMAQVINIVMSYSNIQYKALGAIVISICYTFQIYFDFSGYSDMAIGLGKMMGFNYNENFNYPYIAISITEFWRRWHISLSSFFRDYVYIPLGGNRVKWHRHIFNILVVWFLTGMWHGANWNFILWGLYYGVLLILEKYVLAGILKYIPKIICYPFTMALVIFGWIIFYFSDMTELVEFVSTLFGKYGIGSMEFLNNIGIVTNVNYVILALAIIGSTPICKKMYEKTKKHLVCSLVYDIIIILMYMLAICEIVVGSFNPFIYYKF